MQARPAGQHRDPTLPAPASSPAHAFGTGLLHRCADPPGGTALPHPIGPVPIACLAHSMLISSLYISEVCTIV